MRASIMLLSAGLMLSMLAAYGTAADDGIIGCSYVTGARNRPGKFKYQFKNMPTDLCTHIFYYGVMVDPEGNVLTYNNDYEEFRSFKQSHPETTLIMTVMVDQQAANSFQKKSFRQYFISELKPLMDLHHIDAVAITYISLEEALAANEDLDLLIIVDDLKKAFANSRTPRKVFLLPTNVKDLERYWTNKTAVCNSADYVVIDLSELRSTKDSFADVPSPLRKRPHDVANYTDFNVEDITQSFLDAGCAPQKLILSVLLMGMLHKLSNPAQATIGSPSVGRLPWQSVHQMEGAQAYYEFCHRIDEVGWTSGWDPIGAAPYIYSKRRWIGYENERSLEERVRFLKEKHLAGINMFSADMDDYAGQCGRKYPLLRAVNKVMRAQN